MWFVLVAEQVRSFSCIGLGRCYLRDIWHCTELIGTQCPVIGHQVTHTTHLEVLLKDWVITDGDFRIASHGQTVRQEKENTYPYYFDWIQLLVPMRANFLLKLGSR